MHDCEFTTSCLMLLLHLSTFVCMRNEKILMRVTDTRPRREHAYDGENLVVYVLVFLHTYGLINTIVSLLRKQ